MHRVNYNVNYNYTFSFIYKQYRCTSILYNPIKPITFLCFGGSTTLITTTLITTSSFITTFIKKEKKQKQTLHLDMTKQCTKYTNHLFIVYSHKWLKNLRAIVIMYSLHSMSLIAQYAFQCVMSNIVHRPCILTCTGRCMQSIQNLYIQSYTK